jgi:hypothetical protein
MAIKPYTVFYNVQNYGTQAEFKWAEKELVTGKGLEKNNGLKAVPGESKPLITSEPQSCTFVTIEAETELEAAEAVTTFLTRGITNPSKAAPAVVLQGTGGGLTNNKVLACVSTALKEELAVP